LFTAEGAAYLRPAGPAVHVGDAAIRACGGGEPLRFAQVVREDRGREPLRHGVVDANSVLERLVAVHVQYGRERLSCDDGRGGRDVHERGTSIKTALRDA